MQQLRGTKQTTNAPTGAVGKKKKGKEHSATPEGPGRVLKGEREGFGKGVAPAHLRAGLIGRRQLIDKCKEAWLWAHALLFRSLAPHRTAVRAGCCMQNRLAFRAVVFWVEGGG